MIWRVIVSMIRRICFDILVLKERMGNSLRKKRTGMKSPAYFFLLLVLITAGAAGCDGGKKGTASLPAEKQESSDNRITQIPVADGEGNELAAESETSSESIYMVAPYDTSLDFKRDNGINLLAGIEPDITDKQGSKVTPYAGEAEELTSCSNYFKHIDIIGDNQVSITYDLGRTAELDKIIIGGFYHPDINYCFGRYALYFSEDRATLYEEENCLADYDNSKSWEAGQERKGADQVFTFTKKPQGRYFGIRFLQPNPTDNLIRISRLALYNERNTLMNTYLDKYGSNILMGMIPDRGGKAAGSASEKQISILNDGVVFSEKSYLTEEGEEAFVYSLKDSVTIDRLVTVGRGINKGISYYISSNRKELWEEESFVSEEGAYMEEREGREVYILNIKNGRKGKFLGIKMNGGNEKMQVEELAAFSDDRNLYVDTADVINPDFAGYGVNVIPTALMEESLKDGYREEYFELEAARILTVRPKVARMWFQIDWMEEEKGVYGFDSVKMKSVYRYLDAFQAAGTEIELNFGWKVGSAVWSWFGSEKEEEQKASAPKDLESYAASCAALLKELIVNRGYTNIKYLSAYNESHFSGEFQMSGDKKEYYLKMMKEIDSRLKAEGIRKLVKIWGPEDSDNTEWFGYMADNGGDTFDAYSFHLYEQTEEGLANRARERKVLAREKPVYLTEFGFYSKDESWERSNTGYAITAANQGLSGALFWLMAGVTLTDPESFTISDGDRHLWGPPQKGPDRIYGNFYELGMLMRFVPGHSRVYSVDNTSEDLKAGVFQSAKGDITIVVQAKETPQRKRINLVFDKEIGKTFTKYSYTREFDGEGKNCLPEGEAVINTGNTLTDIIGSGYTTVVYTTLAE